MWATAGVIVEIYPPEFELCRLKSILNRMLFLWLNSVHGISLGMPMRVLAAVADKSMLAPRGYYEGAMTTGAREPAVLVRNVCYCLAMIDFNPRLAVVFLSVG